MKIAEYVSFYKSLNKTHEEFCESIYELIDKTVKDYLKEKGVNAKVKTHNVRDLGKRYSYVWRTFIYAPDGKEDYVIYCRFNPEKLNFYVLGTWGTGYRDQNVRTEEQMVDAITKVIDSIPNINESTQTDRQRQLAGIITEATSQTLSYDEYATAEFKKEVKRIQDNGMMNMYVEEAIEKKVDSKKLEKEIEKAIKLHRKWGQHGSALHLGVVSAMWGLLGLLRKGN